MVSRGGSTEVMMVLILAAPHPFPPTRTHLPLPLPRGGGKARALGRRWLCFTFCLCVLSGLALSANCLPACGSCCVAEFDEGGM